jgi:3-isopropylmalate/(R)-2-methylmalate dehydratase small subunit
MTEPGIIESRTFNLPADNVDTDQIFPARFLTTTEQSGLGRYCFHDWRTEPGSAYFECFRAFDPDRRRILVSGPNFGCGSSREHASWSLLDAGLSAVISSSFGDIFRANALNNGLLTVAVEPETLQYLLANDDRVVRIDVARRRIDIQGLGGRSFPLDAFAAHCVTHGMDSLEFLLGKIPEIALFEQEYGG